MFGSPGEAAWGWQFAGHHVVLNFTVVDGRYVSPTPCMLGSQPASFGILAPLADDEELGFRLVNSLMLASGMPPSSTIGRRQTWRPGWCRRSAIPNGRTRCSHPNPTT